MTGVIPRDGSPEASHDRGIPRERSPKGSRAPGIPREGSPKGFAGAPHPTACAGDTLA
jgi:hypothetical protein